MPYLNMNCFYGAIIFLGKKFEYLETISNTHKNQAAHITCVFVSDGMLKYQIY